MYQESKKIISLIPETRNDKDSYKLLADVEVVLQEVIENFYLTTQRGSVQSPCNEVMRLCRERTLEAPHYNTVRNRILGRTQFVQLSAETN